MELKNSTSICKVEIQPLVICLVPQWNVFSLDIDYYYCGGSLDQISLPTIHFLSELMALQLIYNDHIGRVLADVLKYSIGEVFSTLLSASQLQVKNVTAG